MRMPFFKQVPKKTLELKNCSIILGQKYSSVSKILIAEPRVCRLTIICRAFKAAKLHNRQRVVHAQFSDSEDNLLDPSENVHSSLNFYINSFYPIEN